MNETGPKIYLLPNLMTAGNLFCGFAATVKILEGALLQNSNSDAAADLFHTAVWFILGACIFRFARWPPRASGRARKRIRSRI